MAERQRGREAGAEVQRCREGKEGKEGEEGEQEEEQQGEQEGEKEGEEGGEKGRKGRKGGGWSIPVSFFSSSDGQPISISFLATRCRFSIDLLLLNVGGEVLRTQRTAHALNFS